MLYQYECEKCGKAFDEAFRVGEAPKDLSCPACKKGRATRVFGSFAIGVNGGINRRSSFGESVRKRNEKAAHRMKGRKPPVRTVAHDFGGGNVREVKP